VIGGDVYGVLEARRGVGVDVRREVARLENEVEERSCVQCPLVTPGSGRRAHGTGNELAVDVRARGAGYLVVADALQRDWVAEVGGRPRRSYRPRPRGRPRPGRGPPGGAAPRLRALGLGPIGVGVSALLLLALALWRPVPRSRRRAPAVISVGAAPRRAPAVVPLP